jgi:hypothetical protein
MRTAVLLASDAAVLPINAELVSVVVQMQLKM